MITTQMTAYPVNDRISKYRLFGIIAGGVLVLDQISKTLVLAGLPLFQSIVVIPGFFSLTHVHNPGGAFGFLSANNSALRHWGFLAAAFFALALIVYYYQKTPATHPYLRTALGLIFGGAGGNLIDRLRFGEVVDFLDFNLGFMHWPTFNVADSAVSIGVIIFFFHVVFKKMPF